MFGFRKSKALLLALLFGSLTAVSGTACQVSIDQTISSSWNNNGDVYTLVQVNLKNMGTENILGVTLKVDDVFDSMWEMVGTGGDLFALPHWRDTTPISPGQSHSWGYIVKSPSVASMAVDNVDCGAQPTQPSTAAPTQPSTPAPTQPSTLPPTEAPTQRPTSRPNPCEPEPTDAPTNPPTNPPTAPPTERPTNPPTDAPTQRPTRPPPTERPTEAPTQRPTRPPTERPTDPPTNPPTTRPTRPPTERPTNPPTQRPTNPPTQRPTNPPTSRPTQGPTNTPGVGRLCPAGSVWAPAPGTTWQWQLTGTIDQSIDVQMYDIDMFDATAATIASLHRAGRAVICYFSTQYEDWRPDADDFTSNVLGSALDDWPGEKYVDIRSSVVRNIMAARLDMAVAKGCDGVEPDNVDEYTNDNGLGITAADQLDFNKFLAQQAHQRGLSVGLKNDLDQVKQLESYFDWALNEQCNQYDECDDLSPFVEAGKAVFGVEYSGSVSSFCPAMKELGFSWLKKGMDLDATVTQCCSSTGGCSDAPYTCVSSIARRAVYDDTVVAEGEFENSKIAENADIARNERSASSIIFPSLAAALLGVGVALFF